jgi:hypothetical protein
MSRSLATALFACAFAAGGASAQPVNTPEQAGKSVGTYLYLMDSGNNKVLLSTTFWRNDPKYDDRAFHRFLDVLAGLEKRGFRKNDKAAIDNWEKPEPWARCYIYLEDLQTAKGGKGGITSNARIWCSDNGISESDVANSDNPKHADLVLQKFDAYLARAKKNLNK